jgi:hypothetical protein
LGGPSSAPDDGGWAARAFSKHERHILIMVRGPRSAKTRRPQWVQTNRCLGIGCLTARPELTDETPPRRILQLLWPIGQVGDESLEVKVVLASAVAEPNALAVDLGIDRLTLLERRQQAEGDAPAQLGVALARCQRNLDVIGMDGVFACQMPDLAAQRIATNAGQNFPAQADLAPGPPDTLLASFPFLLGFERAQLAPHVDPSGVPPVQAAPKGQLIERLIQARLVVDLIRRQVGDHVLHGPSAAMAPRRPRSRVQRFEVVA